MKNKWLAVVVILAIVLLWWWLKKPAAPPPDERLARHTVALCAIAEKHERTPRRGVEALFRYLGENTPDIFAQYGKLLVLIERIDDDDAHDERARQAARRLRAPMRRCEPIFERFGRAVENDPDAKRLLDRGVERLGRTLEILFGAEGLHELQPWLAPALTGGR